MPRATTKAGLIKMANEQFDKLWKMIDLMSREDQNAAFSFEYETGNEAHWKRDKNLRDVLIHLYERHRLLLEWEQVNCTGGNKPFLPGPYTWKTYGKNECGFLGKTSKHTAFKSKGYA